MITHCPICGLSVSVTKAGKIRHHGNGNVHPERVGHRPTCEGTGRLCMKEMAAWQLYKEQITPRDPTAPDYTFSGWLRQNKIHILD